MVRAKLLYVQFSLVEAQPEIFIDSRLGWRSGERGEEELISSPNTSGTLHVTAHAVRTAVHLVSTAGCSGVGTTTDTCRGEGRGERMRAVVTHLPQGAEDNRWWRLDRYIPHPACISVTQTWSQTSALLSQRAPHLAAGGAHVVQQQEAAS